MTKFYSLNKNDLKEIKLSHQYFSMTDTKKTIDSLGIVYPFDINEDIKGFVTASSIIDHHNDNSHLLKHTEVRIANKLNENCLEYENIENTVGVVLHSKKEYNEALDTCFRMNDFQDDLYYETNNNIGLFNIDDCLKNIYKEAKTETIISKDNLEKKEYFFNNSLNYKKNIDDDKKILSLIKKSSLLNKFDLIDVYHYYYEFNELNLLKKKKYYGFLEYMLFNIDSKENETLFKYRERKKYDKDELEKVSSMIDNIITSEKYLFNYEDF